jgi:diguanylate cyclase (GGDEF)-like protein
VISRYGGEEFLVLELHRNLDSAIAAAHAIRAAVANHGPVPSVTASVGVAVANTHSLELPRLDAVEQIVHDAATRADSAMYRAKRAGGDRVEVDTHERYSADRPQ